MGKVQNQQAVKVSTEEVQDVDDFLKACKKKLSPLLDLYASAQRSLSITVGGTPLSLMIQLHKLLEIMQRFTYFSVLQSQNNLKMT